MHAHTALRQHSSEPVDLLLHTLRRLGCDVEQPATGVLSHEAFPLRAEPSHVLGPLRYDELVRGHDADDRLPQASPLELDTDPTDACEGTDSLPRASATHRESDWVSTNI
jgi:hypothetical protein